MGGANPSWMGGGDDVDDVGGGGLVAGYSGGGGGLVAGYSGGGLDVGGGGGGAWVATTPCTPDAAEEATINNSTTHFNGLPGRCRLVGAANPRLLLLAPRMVQGADTPSATDGDTGSIGRAPRCRSIRTERHTRLPPATCVWNLRK